MIGVDTNSENRVIVIRYKNYEGSDYIVDENYPPDPDFNLTATKDAKLYYTEERGFWYEYYDRPQT